MMLLGSPAWCQSRLVTWTAFLKDEPCKMMQMRPTFVSWINESVVDLLWSGPSLLSKSAASLTRRAQANYAKFNSAKAPDYTSNQPAVSCMPWMAHQEEKDGPSGSALPS